MLSLWFYSHNVLLSMANKRKIYMHKKGLWSSQVLLKHWNCKLNRLFTLSIWTSLDSLDLAVCPPCIPGRIKTNQVPLFGRKRSSSFGGSSSKSTVGDMASERTAVHMHRAYAQFAAGAIGEMSSNTFNYFFGPSITILPQLVTHKENYFIILIMIWVMTTVPYGCEDHFHSFPAFLQGIKKCGHYFLTFHHFTVTKELDLSTPKPWPLQ